jgi:hypothetical protein
MSNTTVLRPAGQTVALSVTNSAHASVQINASTNDQINFATFLNTGAAPIAISMSNASPAAAPTFPADGTNGSFVLPAAMTLPLTLATPAAPFYLTALSNSGTAGLLYITPVGDQS